LCESARQLTGRATAVVLRDPNSQLPAVVAVSHDADRRWLSVRVSAESAAGRASRGSQAVVAPTSAELLGGAPPDRRRAEDGGTAYPLRDARDGAGALIVFGPHDTIEPRVREQLARLALAAGPRLASAAALRAAEARALTDELTGLPNRRALHRAVAATPEGLGALLALDLDHFKAVNDTHGHAAGDMVLKHLAHVISGSLRDGDLAARTGGEEFSLWLPGAGMTVATEVAERIRAAVAAARANWQGNVVALTCSIGVAVCPESATQTQNLAALADAALYRAKHGGRNRVEVASSATLTRGPAFE
jgi:diguanylate cyclase (GGDEF)-like protein